MTTQILIDRIDKIYRDIELIKLAVAASEIRPGYEKHYKVGAIGNLGEAMASLMRAQQELKGLQ